MTTKVEITASCGNDKEVHISTTGLASGDAKLVLQNGETSHHVVYDDIEVRVKEVKK